MRASARGEGGEQRLRGSVDPLAVARGEKVEEQPAQCCEQQGRGALRSGVRTIDLDDSHGCAIAQIPPFVHGSLPTGDRGNGQLGRPDPVRAYQPFGDERPDQPNPSLNLAARTGRATED